MRVLGVHVLVPEGGQERVVYYRRFCTLPPRVSCRHNCRQMVNNKAPSSTSLLPSLAVWVFRPFLLAAIDQVQVAKGQTVSYSETGKVRSLSYST